jgi:hypothetical protein
MHFDGRSNVGGDHSTVFLVRVDDSLRLRNHTRHFAWTDLEMGYSIIVMISSEFSARLEGDGG